MKNILLLGNGFDLYYKLATKYTNFLNVVNYLLNNRGTSIKTIGDVFSQKSLQEVDKFIAECYEVHQQSFDVTPLDKNSILEIIRLTKSNLWFSYFNKVFSKDVGWIDFEKEVDFVLECFEKAFEKSTVVHFKADEKHIQYVIELFGFYIDKFASKKVVTIGTYKVNVEYCKEYPLGSGNYIVDQEKVVDKLYDELYDLSKALKLYLECFVENACELIKNEKSFRRIDFLSHIEKTITFNYTNTYEKLYYNNSAFHIHGDVNKEIVLGINPDYTDKLDNLNTTFVCFKKYFQRTLYETDRDYLRWMREFVDVNMSYRLFVMGHSLDITDKDIIEEIFCNSSEIFILYHNYDAKRSYIENLVKIFGKDEFDMLKKKKKLTLISLDQDFSSLKEYLSVESWKDLYDTLEFDKGEKITVI